MALSMLLRPLVISESGVNILGLELAAQSIRGIVTQFMMFICIYLVLTESRAGYITGLLLNAYSIIVATRSMIYTKSSTALPGIISYMAVVAIITLMMIYKQRMANYVAEIMAQKQILEKSERRLYQMAFYDSLTELPNKDLFIDQLEEDIYLAKENKSPLAVMFIDLDSFKLVNDTMGHTAGDTVLQTVANRFRNCLAAEDVVARFAGDEFLIKISSIEEVEELDEICKEILQSFKKPIKVKNVDFLITLSIGVAIYPSDGQTAQSLIKNADTAMYVAKHKGKNQCVYCTPKRNNHPYKPRKVRA